MSLEPHNGGKESHVHLMHRKASNSVSLCVCACARACSVYAGKNRELDEDSQMTKEVDCVRGFSFVVLKIGVLCLGCSVVF